MRIIISNYRYFVSGGPERYMFNVINSFEKMGHIVAPFSVNYTQNKPTPYSRYFVSPIGSEDEVYFVQQKRDVKTILRTINRLFYSREAELAMERMVDEFRPDVAYVLHYLRKLSPSILMALKKAGVPIVVRLSDFGMVCPQVHCLRNGHTCTLCLHGNLLHSIRHRCVMNSFVASCLNTLATWYHRSKGLFGLIDAFVVTNSFMKKLMIKAGYRPERIYCIPTFTDIQRFAPGVSAESPPYILYCGRLEDIKGVHVLIDAFAKLKEYVGDRAPHLVIAGNGAPTYEKNLSSRVRALGLEDFVRFTGHLNTEELAPLIRNARFSVIPSICFENLPNALLESMASGTPVVVSNIGTLKEIVAQSGAGLLFEAGDVDSLAEKLIYCFDHPGEVRKMALQAREKTERDYAPEVHMAALTSLFKKMSS